MNIIEIFITTALFIPLYIIWKKVLDKTDNYLRNKLTEKQYTIINVLVFIAMLLIMIASIIKWLFS